ncbi:MAG: universal stress protein [Dermatophilaceae bacterium]
MDNDAARGPFTTDGAIVVGVDGTDVDQTCMTWAAGEATRTHRCLVVVHALPAFGDLLAANVLGSPYDLDVVEPELRESPVVGRAIGVALRAFPDVVVTGQAVLGRPEQILIEASEDAYLVVVGSKPRRGLARLALGRTAHATTAHCACPVVVIREGARIGADGPVLVATDGSAGSRAAVERAAAEAVERTTGLVVLTTWFLEMVDGYVVTTPGTDDWNQIEQRYRSLVDGDVAAARRAHPDLQIEVRVERGPTAPTVVAAAADVDLLVIGSRGRGGFRGMLLGSVSQQVVESADCPVMVVRTPRD